MDWDDLRYVLAVSRDRSLSVAGRTLGVSHTTVGRRIRTIEDRLGVRLFDRTPDAFVATPAGRDMAEVAERLEVEVLAAESRVLGRDEQLEGKLRVATMDLLYRGHHRAFATFMERYPSVELTVGFSDTEVSLARREADVALRLTSTPPQYLVGRKIGRVEFAVYGSKELVARAGKRPTYGDFPWIHWDERLAMRWLDEWLAQAAPNARIAMRFDGPSTVLREVIASGVGVHFLACFDGDADPRLERIGPVETAFGRDVWLLTLPELKSTSRIRAFMDHVEESVSGKRRRRARAK